jgi:hypothetical protein
VTGAQGAWYDPSDFSTLFQDSAGSTPVTAVEQPVRLMRDRSGRGNDATAPNDASRPVLRARYNQLTFSEQFDNAAWVKSNATVTANAGAAPDGTTTADQVTTTGADGYIIPSSSLFAAAGGATFVYSVFAKAGTATTITLLLGATVNYVGTFNLSTGVASTSSANTTVSMTDAGSGWYRCVLTCAAVTSIGYAEAQIGRVASGLTFLVWGADLKTAADQTSTGGAYQRIAAATDYDTSNPVFRPYLAFDGSDDQMTIASSIHDVFQNVGGGTMWAGYGATAGTLDVVGVATDTSFARAVIVTDRAGGRRLDADTFAGAVDAGFVANTLYVGTNVSDWTGGNVIRRTNGVQVASAAYSSGAGNTSNTASAAARIGVNLPGTGAFLNGRLYSAIILGRAATASELTATETWINGKTGAY